MEETGLIGYNLRQIDIGWNNMEFIGHLLNQGLKNANKVDSNFFKFMNQHNYKKDETKLAASGLYADYYVKLPLILSRIFDSMNCFPQRF